MHASNILRYGCVTQDEIAATIKNPFQSSGPNVLDKTNPEEGNPMNLCNLHKSLLEDVS